MINKALSPQALYQIICSMFSVLVVVSNILSAKMVVVPLLLITVPAGLIIYPITFLISDLVTEIFGADKARLMVFTALAMSLFSFTILKVGLILPGANFDEHKAFEMILGLTGLRVFSSIISYITSHIVDIQVYAALKRITGPKFLWLRNNMSTCLAQIVDTIMLDLIFLWWGLGMAMSDVLPIMIFSYTYKVCFSLASTPLFYAMVYLFRGLLPKESDYKIVQTESI